MANADSYRLTFPATSLLQQKKKSDMSRPMIELHSNTHDDTGLRDAFVRCGFENINRLFLLEFADSLGFQELLQCTAYRVRSSLKTIVLWDSIQPWHRLFELKMDMQ